MNYKESTLTGTSWTRCRCVTITNPLAGTTPPTAYFQEERVVEIDGGNTTMDASSCSKPFDPASVITMLNPITGLPTGTTTTHGELYAILYSLYMQTAIERDAAL